MQGNLLTTYMNFLKSNFLQKNNRGDNCRDAAACF